MKKTILLLLLSPFYVHAQFLPELIPGYSSPAGYNEPLDPTYIPGQLYRVDYYSLAPNQSDLYLDYHYLIETDTSFKPLRRSRYIDDITEYTQNTKYVVDYTYSNSKLRRLYFWNQKINTSVLTPNSIDSFHYENDLLKIRDRWSIDADSGTIKQTLGNEYLYDSLNRYIKYTPYNLDIQSGITYAGYYTIDSFTLSGKPARIKPFTAPVDTNHIDANYSFITYDNLERVSSLSRYMRLTNNQTYFRIDSTVYLYSGTKLYPDSILTFATGSTPTISNKKIFSYTPSGTISEIISYRKQGTDFIISGKEVYTPLLSSALDERKDLSAQFKMIPNPNQGSFRLVLPDEFLDGTISIANILGEEVYKQQTNTSEISMNPNLKPGIYYVTLRTQSGSLSKKLVIH